MDTITAERSIVVAADRERVWRAISQPKQFSKWFKEPQMDFDRLAVGQVMNFRSGDQIHPPGKIAMVEPPERFGFYWQVAQGNPAMTLVTFKLETVPEGTRITVTEQGFEQLPGDLPETISKRNTQGWGIALDRLAEYLRDPGNG